MQFEKLKIKSKNKEESSLIQRALFSMGYYWGDKKNPTNNIPLDFENEVWFFTNQKGVITFEDSFISISKEDLIRRRFFLSDILEKEISEISSFFLTAEIQEDYSYYLGSYEFETESFLILIDTFIKRKMSFMSNEEEQGIQTGYYIDNNNEIEIDFFELHLFRKDLDQKIILQDDIEEKIINSIVKKINFEL